MSARLFAVALCLAGLACRTSGDAAAGVDSLNAALIQTFRNHDAQAYGAIFTDSAVFEWPAFNTVRGRAALTAMAQSTWASLQDMDLRLTVANRRFGSNQVTEFGAFEQSWNDEKGVRNTEFGRYVAVLARQQDGRWLMDRFFGFEDSTRKSR